MDGWQQQFSRISDFHHLVGSQRPKSTDTVELSEKTKIWRRGVMKVLSAALRNKELGELIEQYIYGTRATPAGAFNCLWSALLDFLVAAGEQGCVDAILAYYLEKQPNGALEATWRSGVDRLVPGLVGASQAQEAWHHNRLRVALGPRQQQLESVFNNLQNLQNFLACTSVFFSLLPRL